MENFDPSLPLEKASTIPAEWYLEAPAYERERDSIFRRYWTVAGRTDLVEKPGSFLTAEIAGERVVVSRDKAGELHAFTNVCRHRAARVVVAESGTASFFQCRYHGWTYDLQGKLKGTPEFDGVCDFTKESNCLPKWKVATWGPLVFVTMDPEAPPLEKFLSPLPEQMNEKLAGLGFVKRTEYVLNCNWKIFVDNYLDGGYHVNTIHPSLAGVLDSSQYRTEIAGFTSVQSSPLQAKEVKLGDISVANVRKGDRAYYWWVFPNLMLNIYDGTMDTNLVYPLGPDKCRVVFDYFFRDKEGAEAKTFIEQSTAVAHQIQLEDLEICEDVQRGLSSRTYSTGRFSVRREKAGYHFHQLLAKALS